MSSAIFSLLNLFNGPPGRTPGKIPGGRAVMAFRAAFAALLAGAIYFARVGPPAIYWVYHVFTLLTPILAVLLVQKDLGSSTAMCLMAAMTNTLYLVIGTLVASLAFAMSGLRFYNWVLCVFIGPTMFFTTILVKTAEVVPPPSFMFSSDQFVWVTAFPLVAFINKGDEVFNLEPLLQMFTGYLAMFWAAAGIAFLAANLPCGLGAPPGWRTVPSSLAALLQDLGGYTAVVSFMRNDSKERHPLVDRRELLRHQVLASTAKLRQYMKTAMGERCGGYFGQSQHALQLARDAEVCRLAIMMQHKADLKPRSALTQAFLYEGPFNAALQEVQRETSRTLHAASSLVSQIAGLVPPKTDRGVDAPAEEVFVDEDECRRLAAECQVAAQQLRDQWRDVSTSSASMQRQVSAVGLGDRTRAEEIWSKISLEDVCQAEASASGTLAAAEAASKAAISAADYAAERENASLLTAYCKPPCGGCGILKWLQIPTAGPKVWTEGFQRGWRFALRVSTAMTIVFIFVATVPIPDDDPAHGLWVVLTTGLLLTPVLGASIAKTLLRIIGSLVGAALVIALILITQWEYAGLWVWLGVIAFVVKFFEPELLYAGLVAFITYARVSMIMLMYPFDFKRALEAAGYRLLETLGGVIVAGLVSVFIAPDRSTPRVRAKELEALSSSASILGAVSKALSAEVPSRTGLVRASGRGTLLAGVEANEQDEEGRDIDGRVGEDDRSSEVPSVEELRASSWDIMQEFFFGGDGSPGVGDTLMETRFESCMAADSGFELCFGVFWLPDVYCRCCCDSGLAPGVNCLDAVTHISALTRGTQVMVSLLEAGYQGGGDVLLSDARVDQAIGPRGEGFAAAVAGVVANLAPILKSRGTSESSVTQKLLEGATGMHELHFHDDGDTAQGNAIAAARARLDEADTRLALLFDAADAARSKVGGAIMSPSQASVGNLGVHRMAATLFLMKETLSTMRHVISSLAGEG